MINVREVLETHSQATTLRELEAQGRSKVRVIKASEISRLIEEAVRQAIASSEGHEDVQELIERSKAEFRELKRQRDQEHQAREEGARQLERARKELEAVVQQMGELRDAETASRSHAGELEALLTKERQRSNELQQLLDAVSAERDAARASERRAREEADALRNVSTDAAPVTPLGTAREAPLENPSDLLTKLAEQVAKLSEKLDKAPPTPIPAGPAVNVDAVNAKLDALTSGIAERLEKFGRSLSTSGGTGSAPGVVEAEAIRYDAIFGSKEKLESNMGTVEVKQQKGAGIGGALDRMKKLKLGPSAGGSGS